ncbi:MAG: hypothetical protein K6B41_05365 [Butyrivibrio sp.]|nr:hypothetical protein [Butyrivibrio sp.]
MGVSIYYLDERFHNSTLTLVASLILFFALIILFVYFLTNTPFARLKHKIRTIRRLSDSDKSPIYQMTPHFGKLFGEKQINDFIKNETFHKYIYRDGSRSKNIKISESGNWLLIMDTYLPLDFICGITYSSEINTIDGSTIKIFPNDGYIPDDAHSDLKKFFKERGYNYNPLPYNTKQAFQKALSRPINELDKADWGKIRYLWEKEISKKIGYFSDKSIFGRVLSDKEMKKIIRSVKNNQNELSKYMILDEYSNEYCVCNGIELIKALPIEKQTAGIDFLFSCLGRPDRAYFFQASDLLVTMPDSLCKRKIDKELRLSYKNNDIQKIAGILYLAQKLNYETNLTNMEKEPQNA